jgi:uncharacterized protein (DUF924 family)
VLKAWLACGGSKSEKIRADWFDGNAPCQVHIAKNPEWEPVYRDALRGEFDEWLSDSDAEKHLALVLVLDQFSRILYSDKETYTGHARALEISRKAVASGMDARLPPELRMWFYFPFLHSEEMHDQEQSRALFTALVRQHPEMKPVMPSVHAHHDAVKRFGRLPERNKTLNRASTVAESRKEIFEGVSHQLTHA